MMLEFLRAFPIPAACCMVRVWDCQPDFAVETRNAKCRMVPNEVEMILLVYRKMPIERIDALTRTTPCQSPLIA
jgi:hypothetical protein